MKQYMNEITELTIELNVLFESALFSTLIAIGLKNNVILKLLNTVDFIHPWDR